MTKNKKKSFVLYEDMSDMFALLSYEERGILISAIFNYVKNGVEGAEMSPVLLMAFASIKATLDRDAEAYERRCIANAENGKKGGRPPKTERFFEKPKKADSDSDSDSDNDNESDNDIDSGSDSESESESESVSVRFSVSDECSAPATPSPTPPAGTPCLTEKEKSLLVSRGVPPEYIREREARACEYARKHGKSVTELLLEWYLRDNAQQKQGLRAGARDALVMRSGAELNAYFEQMVKERWG